MEKYTTLLSVSRAARLVGVTRGALQKKIKNGELPTFEGMIQAEDLLHVYPKAHLEENKELQRVTEIKQNAFAKRVREHTLPDAEVLAERLIEMSKDFAHVKGQLQHYRAVVQQLIDKFSEVENKKKSDKTVALDSLKKWLLETLEKGPEQTDYLQPFIAQDSFLRIISAHVSILPSNHDFFVEGNDTLLDSGLRAGLALNYGCSDGSCGLCTAKIMSGKIKQVRQHEYVIGEKEKKQGYALLCSNTAITDLVIEAIEVTDVHNITAQKFSAKVKDIDFPAKDILVLHLQTPKAHRLRYLPGQYATLETQTGLKGECFIASCPCDDRYLQFHIPKSKNNEFSNHLFNKLKRGEIIHIDGPKGEFLLQSSQNSLLFFAYETGFAPIKSLIEQAIAFDFAESIHLYWITSRKGHHYMHNLCRAWADALDNFKYTALFVDETVTEVKDELHKKLMHHLQHDYPELTDFDAYVAGPKLRVDDIKNTLLELGLPKAQLYSETVR